MLPLGVFATPDEDLVFVITKYVRNDAENHLWIRSYNSIREFYPDVLVVIIDDNSPYQVPADDLTNAIVLQSEYPGAGELLPYYYFLKYQWAEKMVFLHDSMLMKRRFTDDELVDPMKFHWHFDVHCYDDDPLIDKHLSKLENGSDLVDFNHQKSLWVGNAGATSIIDLKVIIDVENKYAFPSALVTELKNRTDRMALERIFAIVMFKEGYATRLDPSNFGSIFDFPGYWQNSSDSALKLLKETYPGAILKTWHGR